MELVELLLVAGEWQWHEYVNRVAKLDLGPIKRLLALRAW